PDHDEVDSSSDEVDGGEYDDSHQRYWQVEQPVAHRFSTPARSSSPSLLLTLKNASSIFVFSSQSGCDVSYTTKGGQRQSRQPARGGKNLPLSQKFIQLPLRSPSNGHELRAALYLGRSASRAYRSRLSKGGIK